MLPRLRQVAGEQCSQLHGVELEAGGRDVGDVIGRGLGGLQQVGSLGGDLLIKHFIYFLFLKCYVDVVTEHFELHWVPKSEVYSYSCSS